MTDESQPSFPPPTPDPGGFFVGYLPKPTGLMIFSFLIAVIGVGMAVGAGLAWALAQQDPGPGRLVFPAETVTGIMKAYPHPTVHVPPSEKHPEGRAIVLAGQSKRGVDKKARSLDGKPVTIKGILTIRDSAVDLIQLSNRAIKPAEDKAIAALGDFAVADPEAKGRFTLDEEIVDSKCYLGAMKPGEGKVHMACANLCLIGGVPPLFVVYKEEGDPVYLLLVGPDGKAISDKVLDWTSLYIRASGEVRKQGQMLMFQLEPDSIEVL